MAYILIDKANFYHNLSQLALKAGGKKRLAVVLKDNAYGHGLELMAELAAEYGIRQAVVISRREAERILAFFDHVLILGGRPEPIEKCSFAVSELRVLEEIDPETLIELKVDTGMHRNGIDPRDLATALEIVRRRGLRLHGVMTHYRSADELTSEYFWQKKRFETVKRRVRKAGFTPRFHSHNSAALLRCKGFDEEIARVGIAIYGYNTLPEGFDPVELRPVLSLWARRTSTRRVEAGARIGYGGSYTVLRAMTVSTYDLGYGDGWPRGDAADSYMTGEGLPILGRVSMDFVTLEGDRETVCIMADAQRAAKHYGTICYEMTTALMPTIYRTVKEQR